MASSAANAIKWGMQAGAVAERIDSLRTAVPRGEWTPEPVKLATYNLCSMQAEGAEASLVMQVEEAGVDAIGYQETRARHAYDKVYKDKWWMCSSGQPSNNSCGGCGSWTNLESVWASNGEAVASPKSDAIHICHCEPRQLVVKMILVTARIIFVVPHAPHSGRP